ncbi:transglutaminase domain-containing protein [Chloroflexota bacterium]
MTKTVIQAGILLTVFAIILAACAPTPAISPPSAPQEPGTASVPVSEPEPATISAPITASSEDSQSYLKYQRTDNILDYIEPANTRIRNTAIFAIRDTPPGISSNSDEWKIWKINYWVANNITYISDPYGQEYYAYAHETLDIKGGDCDDFVILLASLYESVGLDAAITYVDTKGDEQINHMACLVYYSDTSQSFLDKTKAIMEAAGVESPTAEIRIMYIDAENTQFSSNYSKGIWIIADPTMAKVKDMVGHITHKPYDLISMLEAGN